MKKFKTIMMWVVFVIALGGLALSTYFTQTGANEWWNTHVASWVGGASLAVASTTVIQTIVNYSAKSDLNLGIRDFSKSAKEFIQAGQNTSDDLKTVLGKLQVKEEQLDKAIAMYNDLFSKLEKVFDQLDLIIENEKQIANHDESMIRDGTTAKLNQSIVELENKNYGEESGSGNQN